MKLSGHTTPFAVLGHPIGHSLSPDMHNASLQSLGMDAVYLAFDVAPEHLMKVLHSMYDMGFKGVNLTIPLKETAFENLENLDDSARRVKAVNTVEFMANGILRGHNTDGKGFLLALQEVFNATVEKKSVFILGSGGAGRALAITCASEGARAVCIADIDTERTARLAGELNTLFPGLAVETAGADTRSWGSASLEADLVIQATPVGMKPQDKPLLKQTAFRKGQMLFDLVYMYPRTGIMEEALKAGAAVSNGLGMLLHQGAYAFTIWTGRQADTAAMRRALEASVYGT